MPGTAPMFTRCAAVQNKMHKNWHEDPKKQYNERLSERGAEQGEGEPAGKLTLTRDAVTRSCRVRTVPRLSRRSCLCSSGDAALWVAGAVHSVYEAAGLKQSDSFVKNA